MTTVLAVRCKDGIIMGSDTQETTDTLKERTSKVIPIGKNAILGCAGLKPYVNIFAKEHLVPKIDGKKGSEDYLDVIKKATLSFRKDVKGFAESLPSSLWYKYEIRNNMYPSAILAVVHPENKRNRIFNIVTSQMPIELTPDERDRCVIGSGEPYAHTIFDLAERLLRNMSSDRKVWITFSTETISKFAYLLIQRVMSHDLHTGGFPVIYGRDEKHGYLRLDYDDIFPKSDDKSELAQLIHLAINDIGKKRLKGLHDTYHFDLSQIQQQITSILGHSV